MTIKDISTILFDYGGTLDTDARHWSHVLWEGYVHAAIPVSEAQFRDAYVAGERALARTPIIQSTDDFHTLLLKKVELELENLEATHAWQEAAEKRREAAHIVADYCDDYVRRNLVTTRCVLETVRRTRRLVLVTNFYGNMHAVLRAYGLADLFSAIIESAVVGVRKPDATIYRLGLEAAHATASQTLVVGDSYGKDIVPAASLGCRTVWLKGQGWSNDEQQDESRPTAIIHHLSELPALLDTAL